jgi:choline dehydrogenase-like flavoprotein
MAYDIVVVGGGSAGCVLATRLSTSGRRVLLHPARIVEIISPAGFEGYFRELVEMLHRRTMCDSTATVVEARMTPSHRSHRGLRPARSPLPRPAN